MPNFFENRLNKLREWISPTTETEVKNISLLGWGDCHYKHTLTAKIYKKILIETMDRAIIPNEIEKQGFNLTVYDSYSPHKRGLASIIAHAIARNKRIFIEKKPFLSVPNAYSFKVVKNYDPKDGEEIPNNYIELDFRTFYESKIVCLLAELLLMILEGANAGLVVSKAIIYKIHALTEMIDNTQNREPLVKQLEDLNGSIRNGQAGVIDAKSSIEQMQYDAKSATETQTMIWKMIASLVGLPMSDLNSEVVTGLGSGDNGDADRRDAAYKQYFYDITSNVLFSVYGLNFEYQHLNLSTINSMTSALMTIETSTAFTSQGKGKLLLNLTGLEKEDISYFQAEQTPPATPPENNEG